RQLPRQHPRPSYVRVAAGLSVPAGPLARQIACAATFGQLWEWVQTHRAVWRRGRLTTLPVALAELRYLIARHEAAGTQRETRLVRPGPTGQPLAPGQQIEAVLRGPMAMQLF
ncbi:MAG: hypothetical protein H7Z21_09700, partial [Hymenobacter sp.]|nr:hypothetical protein [Hymenobacter sp.]